jgi:hypothetical protein
LDPSACPGLAYQKLDPDLKVKGGIYDTYDHESDYKWHGPRTKKKTANAGHTSEKKTGNPTWLPCSIIFLFRTPSDLSNNLSSNLVQLLVLDGPAFGPNVTLGKLVENLFLPVQVSESEPESNSTGSSETVNVEHVSFDAGLDDK